MNLKKHLLDAGLGIVLLSGLAACNFPTQAAPTSPVLSPTTAAIPTGTLAEHPPTIDPGTAGWPAYTDSTLGFSLSHPPGWELCQTLELSTVFCETGATGASFPAFYATLVEPTDAREGYNVVDPETFQRFSELSVGQSFTTGDPNPDFSTFTRLPDIQVGGETGIVVENVRVWEGGPETKDRRVFVRHADTVYMIGTYYETAEDLAIFQSVLNTFRFE